MALSTSDSCTATVMLCSEDPWVMSTTLTCPMDRAMNIRLEYPGMPTIPPPTSVISAIPSIDDTPRTPEPASGDALIVVPFDSVSKVLRMTSGMPASRNGINVGG